MPVVPGEPASGATAADAGTMGGDDNDNKHKHKHVDKHTDNGTGCAGDKTTGSERTRTRRTGCTTTTTTETAAESGPVTSDASRRIKRHKRGSSILEKV